jgi:hypothetical protein
MCFAECAGDSRECARRERFLQSDSTQISGKLAERMRVTCQELRTHRKPRSRDFNERSIEVTVDAGARHRASNKAATFARGRVDLMHHAHRRCGGALPQPAIPCISRTIRPPW